MEITLKTTIKASSKDIYNAWLNSQGHTKMTGGAAVVTDKVGDEYSAWDGYITGKNIALETNKRIVQTWRSSQFQKNEEDSQIEVLLVESNGQTEITLHHTKVPESGEHYAKGWKEHYFAPMKEFFEGKS